MQEKGIIEKVASSIYIDTNKIVDNYYIFGLSRPNVIFYHMIALYFHCLSIKAANDVYDITVKKVIIVLTKKNIIFYVDSDICQHGLIEMEIPISNKVKTYDIKRCICDIIRTKNRIGI